MTSLTRHLLAGRFALDSRIGSGNYAEVFRATDTHTGELVAVKTLRSEHASEEQAISRFEQEGKAGSAISHDNVVKVSSHGECDGTHFIVMELVKGISLRRRMKLAGPLDVAESLRISVGVLRGLEAIHDAGYVHRDIKPQNILIDASGIPKITDFGITLCPGESRTCAGGLALGTAAYIAPEQAAGQEIGPQADLYSVGAVLFQMLTGEAPFPGDDPIEVMNRHVFEPPRDPRALNSDISPALSAVVLRSLAKEPSARFSSARHMGRALEMLQEEALKPAPRRRESSPDKIAWTVPLAPRRYPLGLANVPILTTLVSALLLIVLFIVIVLALISSAVNANSSKGQISNSSAPSGSAGSPTPFDDPRQILARANAAMRTVTNRPTATASATSTPAEVPQTADENGEGTSDKSPPVARLGAGGPSGSGNNGHGQGNTAKGASSKPHKTPKKQP